MLVIVSSFPQMWGGLFISTNIPDLQSAGITQMSVTGLYLDMAALCL